MDQIFPEERLLADFTHLHHSISSDRNDVIDITAICDEHPFAALHSCAYEALFHLRVQLLIGDSHFSTRNGLKRSQLCFSLSACAILFLQHTEPFDGVIRQMFQVMFDLRDVTF